jgi:pilus assembly protein CpaB
MAMLGVVGLLVALYVGKKLLARDTSPPRDAVINVPMALTDLEPGTRITEAHVAMGPALESKITRDVVRTSRVVVGRVVKNKLLAAQPIKTTDLYPPGQNAPLELEPGMVAVTVPLTSPTAAQRGQYVNVHFTPATDPDAAETGGQTMTLFRGVKILELAGGGRGSASVTLELTREQSNILLLAKDRGTLNLVYAPEGKGNGGVAVSDEDRATLYEILNYHPKPETPPVPPFRTDVFRGSTRGSYYFRNGAQLDDYRPTGGALAIPQGDSSSNNPGSSGNGGRGPASSGAGNQQEAPST